MNLGAYFGKVCYNIFIKNKKGENMFIKQLEIENFKTISKKEIFNFHNGINVLQGKNGVGKSNILDSINFLQGKKDKRVSNNEQFFHNYDFSKAVKVKLITDANDTIERILKWYSSGVTKSTYYINGELSTKEKANEFLRNLNIEIIDNEKCLEIFENIPEHVKIIKEKSQNIQILTTSHLRPIIELADNIITIHKKVNPINL